ncbi:MULTISPECIES: restriction endonuclease PLD domain-containing protein [unclassified Microcoleus]|uniref:restriction endonuclease PLD domain-containing protein n=1 Tax=unclassified Microcoleus TaxID=2642155 RepID=UPI002FD52F2F
MSVIRKFVILEDSQKSLETTIDFLLDCKEYSWDKIYLFSAFVSDDGVKKVKKILEHPYLDENTEVVIAIGTKNHFNDPSNIQDLLKFIKESTKIKAKPVLICPKNNFHIKAYCFLGRRDNREIGFSIIGSSNLTKAGLECDGELCISIHNLNLTKDFIYRLSNKCRNSRPWDQEIMEYEIKYNEKHPRKDQALITSTPLGGKFIELGVLTDSGLLAKATTLANYSDNIDCFHSNQAIDKEKNDVPQNSLCILFSTENNIFRIVKIMSHCSYKEETEGCFVTYEKNVTYELNEDIGEILANEKYKIISVPENMKELPYKTLKDFEEEVNEYQEYQKMLDEPKYQKWIEKGKKKRQLEILDRILQIGDPILMKQELELLRQSI